MIFFQISHKENFIEVLDSYIFFLVKDKESFKSSLLNSGFQCPLLVGKELYDS